jgi:flavin-dependent dehydrogenase
VLYGDNGEVIGVATGDMGIEKDGSIGPAFERGMALQAKYTIFAEGARGHLGRQLIARYKLDEGKDPQAYGIGIKELWQIDPARHEPGLVVHAAGWPLDNDTYGGAFLYHADGGKVAIGYVVGLDYRNPWLSRSRNSSASRPTRPSASTWKAAPASATARHHRRWPDVAAEDGVPRWRAGRLRGRLPQRQPHQGQPRRDQDRHAVRRCRLRRAGCRPPAR